MSYQDTLRYLAASPAPGGLFAPRMRIETLAVHAGHAADPSTGAVTPAIHLSTTFERDLDGGFRAGHIYARTSNPNRDALEEAMAALEGGATAIAYASGSAATMSVFQALSPGDHVIAPHDAYYGTLRQLREIFARWGLEHDAVDMTDMDAVARVLRPETRVVWVETPSNPLVRVVDIARLADLAHTVGARCVVDNTWATPVLQRPLGLGADLVMHSTTKYLGGHSDLLGGAIVARSDDDFVERMRLTQRVGGAIPSPFDCWLLLRGIRTLPWRVAAHCSNAMTVARYLESNRAIEAVHYPGLESHSGHEIATRQMSDFGGMMSIQLHGGEAAALALTHRVKLFTRATSLGGTESLIEHRRSVEGPTSISPENLLRLSIGLEHPDDLIEDLDEALRAH
ncbi:MAG TPA: aminotransferase class I/II-fold pyridoxal phosphate-dependent enzyme [Gemmatimonadaceae bacterium]